MFHAYFNLYSTYTVCKRMCVFVFVFVFVFVCVCVLCLCVSLSLCVCVSVTAGGVRAQRGPGGSRRDVDRSPTECVLSWRLASRRGPQPLFGAPC